MRPKNQRLALAMVALLAMMGAAGLALWGLQDRAAYFVTPSDIAAGKLDVGQPARLGGMVKEGSIVRLDNGTDIQFVVHDGKAEAEVHYSGILPDLFREGSGMVAEGALATDFVFIADRILAKHDERYMPPELDELADTQETVAQESEGQ